MTIDVQSALIGAFVVVAVVAGMLLRQRRRRTDLLFAIFATNLVLWFLATFVHGVAGDVWIRAELAVAALIPATLLTLFQDLVRGSPAGPRRLATWAYPLSSIVALIGASPLGELMPVGAFTGVYVLVMVALTGRVMTQSVARSHSAVETARIRYLAIAAVAVAALTLAGQLPFLGESARALGHAAVMLYVFFLSQAILRDRLLDLHEFLGRMLVLAVLALLFAVISSALILGLGNNPEMRLFNTVVSVVILLTLYEPLKDRLESKSIELFFRERFGFAQLLDQLRRIMLRTLDPSAMSKLVLDTLYDERRCTHAAVYLLEEPLGRGFRLEAFRGPEPVGRVNEREHPALWHAIQRDKAPILSEQLSRSMEHQGTEGASNRDLLDAMRSVSADVLLPFVAGERVLGFLALRDDRVPEPYSTEEIAMLMNVADTAVTVIENSQLARRLLERDRLAAIGEMAAGLAHEIRNPLGAIKGAAEFLEPQDAEDDEQSEFLQVIIDETNRLNGVVSQFLDYARPFRAQFSSADLNQVVRKTAKLIEARADERPSDLHLDLDEELVPIEVDAEQIKQVILNLVLNAVAASAETESPVTISTRYRPERERVELRVQDQGAGIPKDALAHIFIPFFTTKAQGTGLGLAVCQRIVTNHGGDIRVQSVQGEGTQFIIRLPLRRRADKSTTGSFTQTSATPLAALPAPVSYESSAPPRRSDADIEPAKS